MKIHLFLKLLFISLFISSCNNDDETLRVSEGFMRINNRDLNIESSGNIDNAYVILSNNNTVKLIFSDGDISLINNEVFYGDDVTNLVEFELDAIETLESTVYNIPTILNIQDFDFSAPHINYYKIFGEISVENGNIINNTGATYFSGATTAAKFGKIEVDENNAFFDINFKIDYATLPQYSEVDGFFNGPIIILQ